VVVDPQLLILCENSMVATVTTAFADNHGNPALPEVTVLPFDRWTNTPFTAGASYGHDLHAWPTALQVDGCPVGKVIWLAALHDPEANSNDFLVREKWLAACCLVFPEACGIPRACNPSFSADAVTRLIYLSRLLDWDCVSVQPKKVDGDHKDRLDWPPFGYTSEFSFARPGGKASIGALALGRIWRLSDTGAIHDIGPSGLPVSDLFEIIFHETWPDSPKHSNVLVWAAPGLMMTMTLQRSRNAVLTLLKRLVF
jgi:hypothetical protein